MSRVQTEGGMQDLGRLPCGYKFSPTNTELFLYYLKIKIMGQELPADIIPTTDVFACSPDQLPLSEFKYGLPNEWYNGRKGKILTADGYYDLSKTEAIYDKNGLLLGIVRTLDFHHGISPEGIKSQWTVKEFRINPDLIKVKEEDHTTQERLSNLVACQITKLVDSNSSKAVEREEFMEEDFNSSQAVEGEELTDDEVILSS